MSEWDSEIDTTVRPSGAGCVECLEAGGWWFHLRRCVTCGHIGCCDSSPRQHATAHATTHGHLLLTSFEPGEGWFFRYGDEAFFAAGPDLAPPQEHPADQPTPGPAGHVPADWQDHLH